MSGRGSLIAGPLTILLLTVSAFPITGQAAALRIAGYQIGAFVEETHAQAAKNKLGESDLFGEVHQKTVKGTHYWVVLVRISDIPFENIRQKLIDAGFSVLEISKADWDRLTGS